jgi:hypothetical protein
MTETVGKPPARPNKEAFDREIGELNSKIDQLKAQSVSI